MTVSEKRKKLVEWCDAYNGPCVRCPAYVSDAKFCHGPMVPDETIEENYTKVFGDMVNHPAHYTQGGIECIDALRAATVGLEGIEAVCTANAIKYLWRWKHKNGVQDIEKAIWYLERLKEEVAPGD